MAPVSAVRSDRSAGVKDSIRASARRLFTEQGFDATGIREIAADAKVNPALVIRHFGSKEALFIETVDASAALRELVDVPIDRMGAHAARRIVEGRRKGLRAFGAVVRASGRPEIQARLRNSTVAFFAEPLVARLDSVDARLRAHLFAAELTGLMFALVVYEDSYLLDAPHDDIVRLYGDSLQRMLTGP